MRLVIALLAVTLPAAAQTQPQFRFSAPIELASQGPVQRVELPLEVYRDAKWDLSDVRVLNGRGEVVPIAFAGSPDAQREVLPLVDLPAPFTLTKSSTPGSTKGGAEVTIRASDGTLIALRGPAGSKATVRPVAYLLDASLLKDDPIRALIFEWDAAPGSQVVNVRVEASEDLKSWSTLGSGPLVRVESDRRTLTQPKVDFPARKVKYLRVTWSGEGFALKSVRAEKEPRAEPAPRATRTATATPGAKASEYLYDLGGRIPVEAYRVVPADVNDVISVAVATRNDEKETWRTLGWAPFYRLKHDDAEKQSPPVEIGRPLARYWRVTVLGAAAPKPPTLEVQWRPGHVVFVARGEPPFSLAFGDPTAPAVAVPVAAMFPSYERLAELKLPAAKVGAVNAGPQPSRWTQMWRETSPRRLTLWAILLAGVAFLGFMAWRLLRAASAKP